LLPSLLPFSEPLVGGPERGGTPWRTKCECERKETAGKSGKCALLVKPCDLCLIKEKHHRVIAEESAALSAVKPKQFA